MPFFRYLSVNTRNFSCKCGARPVNVPPKKPIPQGLSCLSSIFRKSSQARCKGTAPSPVWAGWLQKIQRPSGQPANGKKTGNRRICSRGGSGCGKERVFIAAGEAATPCILILTDCFHLLISRSSGKLFAYIPEPDRQARKKMSCCRTQTG